MMKINVWRINATIFQNIRNIKQFTLNSIIRELIRNISYCDNYHGGTQPDAVIVTSVLTHRCSELGLGVFTFQNYTYYAWECGV